MKVTERYACHPNDFKNYDTEKIRQEFLIPELFENDETILVYSLFDRFIAGGIVPVSKTLPLETFESLKADHFLDRRELGVINIGGNGVVEADGTKYDLGFKDGLYVGKESKEVKFSSADSKNPAKFYITSAPAHQKFPTTRVTFDQAEKIDLGSKDNCNERRLNKMLVNSVLDTCQLQMGITEIMNGSVWNTMPPHTHNRRMEVYMYFELAEDQAVCHFMGQPQETRHLFMHNEQAVISPSWSIHAGAGTGSYSFVWGMAGENLDYTDMDVAPPKTLR